VKKQQVDHILRAAGDIVGDDQFVIIGSQSLHGRHPDLVDELCVSVEVDLYPKNMPEAGERLCAIGAYSRFHETYGYYADPVGERTAVLPRGWKARLVNLPPGNTNGVVGLCLDPHDLAISKYVAGREKDIELNRELARRGIVSRERLLQLLEDTPITPQDKTRLRRGIEADFARTAR
jgi:hypothetical protein